MNLPGLAGNDAELTHQRQIVPDGPVLNGMLSDGEDSMARSGYPALTGAPLRPCDAIAWSSHAKPGTSLAQAAGRNPRLSRVRVRIVLTGQGGADFRA